MSSLKEIIESLIAFRNERNWEQYHTPENLANSIFIEAAELLENFQWETVETDVNNVQEEIADIVGYCLLLCEHYGFDITTILKEKIAKNADKYPISKAYGRADKYDKL